LEVAVPTRSHPYVILVIEDSELVRSILNTMLTRLGYSVILAADGVEGLVQVRQQLPNLILCDIEMPELNGYEVLEALRSPQGHLAGLAKIPFVLMSGSVTTWIPTPTPNTNHLEPDYYLSKPFTLHELIASVTHLLAPAIAQAS
jgi:CheY-like chemotaxis protein